MKLETIAIAAKKATYQLSVATIEKRNLALSIIADELEANMSSILVANEKDMQAGRNTGLTHAILDRLMLNEARIKSIAMDVRAVIALNDPLGKEFDQRTLANGMQLYRRSEPIGVIGVIYEARPNVTIDIAALCLKSGNVSILRGGKETLHSNLAMVAVIQTALLKAGLPSESVQYIDDPDRDWVLQLLKMDSYIDMIIPRGGEGLHKMCKENSTIPVIIGGFGVSHIYVDATADLNKALKVIINAKVQRPSACNALDTLLINSNIASSLLANLIPLLNQYNISVVADANALSLLDEVTNKREATQEDFDTEWLNYILAIKLVENVEEALDHMREHNACHSDAILTNDPIIAEYFINNAGSAAVYVNASTRFTDGAQFGLGAEVAVSTQKLHVRGPMGLEDLTTYKWVGKGDYLYRE